MNNESIDQLVSVTPITKRNYQSTLFNAFHMKNLERSENFKKTMLFNFIEGIMFTDPDGLRAGTIVEEHSYLSLSYASDFHNYYSHCFKNYPRVCKRIHFFKKEYDTDTFLELIKGGIKSTKELQDNYLGHIVVRPLSAGFVGASLIAPYYEIKTGRHYTAILNYKMNLFGHIIEMRTMPFFEQDRILASCATSALWFSFHKTKTLFESKVPSPGDITLSAGKDSLNSGIVFPSQGLEIQQVNSAIRANDMTPAFLNRVDYLQNSEWLRAYIYAYSRMGVPVLLAFETYNNEPEHLVTINGYRFGERKPKPVKSTTTRKANNKADFSILDIKLRSYHIVKFYAHDDQVGPFARLELFEEYARKVKRSFNIMPVNTKVKTQFRTGWWENIETKQLQEAHATAVFIPLKKDIRLSFQHVYAEVALLNISMKKHWKGKAKLDLHWDIFLQKKGGYKKEIASLYTADECDDSARTVLFRAIPEFIWVIRCYIPVEELELKLFDLLYDAADATIINNTFYINFLSDWFKDFVIKSEMLNNDETEFSFPALDENRAG